MFSSDRLAIILISEIDLISAVRKLLPGKLDLIMHSPTIPDDVRVERVFHKPECGSFAVVLSHPSFEPVAPGMVPPMLHDRREMVQTYNPSAPYYVEVPTH